MEGEWLDADAAASSLQITRATLYKLIRQQRLHARKIGGQWRVSRTHIEELFAGSGTGATPERSGSR
jgi:excisionase family DNA binding protein